MGFKGKAAAVLLAGVLTAAGAEAHASVPNRGTAGVGPIFGNPTGVTGKFWLSGSRALDVGLGFSGDFEFHADHLWHAWNAFPQPQTGALGLYGALGARIEARRGDDEFGIRTIGGINYLFDQAPWELFFEAGPVFRMTPGSSVSMDVGVGARYLFGSVRRYQ